MAAIKAPLSFKPGGPRRLARAISNMPSLRVGNVFRENLLRLPRHSELHEYIVVLSDSSPLVTVVVVGETRPPRNPPQVAPSGASISTYIPRSSQDPGIMPSVDNWHCPIIVVMGPTQH